MIAGLIALFLIIILIDMPGLSNGEKKIKKATIYIFLISVGFVISLLQILDKAPVSPNVMIERIIISLFRVI